MYFGKSSVFFQIIPHPAEFPKPPTRGVEIPQPSFIWAAEPNLKVQVRNCPGRPPPTPPGDFFAIFQDPAKKLDLAETFRLVQSRASNSPMVSRYGHFRFQNGKPAKNSIRFDSGCGTRARTTHPPIPSDIS